MRAQHVVTKVVGEQLDINILLAAITHRSSDEIVTEGMRRNWFNLGHFAGLSQHGVHSSCHHILPRLVLRRTSLQRLAEVSMNAHSQVLRKMDGDPLTDFASVLHDVESNAHAIAVPFDLGSP